MVKWLLSSSLAGLPSEAEQQKRSRAVERKNHTESSLHNTHVLFAQDKQFAQCTMYTLYMCCLHRAGVKNVDCGVCRIVDQCLQRCASIKRVDCKKQPLKGESMRSREH